MSGRADIDEAFEFLSLVYPSMATVVGQMRHLPMPGGMSDAIACASDRDCFYGPRFAGLPIGERAGVMIHEAFHVVLNHVGRFEAMAKAVPGLSHRTFNIAADLVINTMIEGMEGSLASYIGLPSKAVRIDGFKPADLRNSAEAAHRGLRSWAEVAAQEFETVLVILSETGSEPRHAQDDLAFTLGGEPDPDPGPGAGTPAEGRGLFRARIMNALSTAIGDGSDGVLAKLQGKVEKPALDWRRLLRGFMARETSRDKTTTWSTRSRRMASMPTGVAGMPGSMRHRVPRVTAVVDTSGSVAETTITGFVAEVMAIARATGSEVTMMEADVEVARTRKVGRHERLRPVDAAGRGGTDFTAPLQKADLTSPSVIVYLTDLLAPCPRYRPRAPVIWCAIGNAGAMPFGRTIRLPNTAYGG